MIGIGPTVVEGGIRLDSGDVDGSHGSLAANSAVAGCGHWWWGGRRVHSGGPVEDRCKREGGVGGKRGKGYKNNFILLLHYNINLVTNTSGTTIALAICQIMYSMKNKFSKSYSDHGCLLAWGSYVWVHHGTWHLTAFEKGG